jgi:hypothetical protein
MRLGVPTAAVILLMVASCIAISQPAQTPVELPRFDAVSVRPADPEGGTSWRFIPDGVSFENIALSALITEAYGSVLI